MIVTRVYVGICYGRVYCDRMKIHMKRKLFFILFLLIVPFAGCHRVLSLPTYPEYWGEPSNGIKCAITVEKNSWQRGKTALVTVVLDNISERGSVLKTIPAFTLDNEKLWCPVDITGAKHTLPPNAYSTISIGQATTMWTSIDISSLKWDLSSSSIWPEKSFYSLVSPGKHTLRLDIEVIGDGISGWIYSNEVEIEITG